MAGAVEKRLRRRAPTRFLLDVIEEAQRDHSSIVAAGAAFYSFLAILPALAALVLVYGLVFDAADVVDHADLLSRFVPASVVGLVKGELERLASTDTPSLGLGAVGSGLIALWSSTRGTRALIEGLNIAERETECRGTVAMYALSIAFTACGLVLVALVVAFTVALSSLGARLPMWLSLAVPVARTFVLPVMVFLSVTALYRFGSCARRDRDWFSAGAIVATVMWLLASWLFSLYVEDVASYGATFGSVSTVAVFMLWLYVSCRVILIGAEVNVVLRARRDDEARAQAEPAKAAPGLQLPRFMPPKST